MLNCYEASRLLSESQERRLILKERISLKVHTLMCSGCRNFEKQMHFLHRLAREYAKGEEERTKQLKPADRSPSGL
jgi:hypothetical protein